MRQRYTAQQVIDTLHKTHGLVHLTAKYLRCDPETIQNYCKRYPTVQQAKEDARSELVDLATLQLWHAVERGDLSACFFVLRTLGKDRGFSERYEVTGKDGGPIQHASIRIWEEHLQRAHARMDAHKAAIRAQRALEAGHNGHQGDTTEDA